MKWIGITGGIASGKSTVTRRLRTLGYEVLDADEISRQVTAPEGAALSQIFTTFGQKFRLPDGSLDRHALGALVFGREDERRKLEGIIHPLVREKIAKTKAQLEKENRPVAFYDVPLLYEQKMENQFDAVILVSATEELQLQRLMSRDRLSEADAKMRVQSQMPLIKKEKKTSFVIHNTKDLAFLESEISRVLQELKL